MLYQLWVCHCSLSPLWVRTVTPHTTTETLILYVTTIDSDNYTVLSRSLLLRLCDWGRGGMVMAPSHLVLTGPGIVFLSGLGNLLPCWIISLQAQALPFFPTPPPSSLPYFIAVGFSVHKISAFNLPPITKLDMTVHCCPSVFQTREERVRTHAAQGLVLLWLCPDH